MNATVLVTCLAVVTVGSGLAVLVGTLRGRGGPAPTGDHRRCYLGVMLTPVGDRTLIIAGGFGTAVAVSEPTRVSVVRPAPPQPAADPADVARQTRDDEHRTDPIDTELAKILRTSRPQLAADLSPIGSSSRTASR